MFWNKFNLYLDQQKTEFTINLYTNFSNYFNPLTIFDLKGTQVFDIRNLENKFNAHTSTFKDTIQSKVYYNDVVSNLVESVYTKHLEMNRLYNLYSEMDEYTIGLSKDIKTVSSEKNNFDLFDTLFPRSYDDLSMFEFLSCDLDGSLYENISTPDFKLYYPEPFVASPSFVHEEVWFIHILHYQHWLWFFFITLIMFYFITFINVVRWCNPRNKPKRETRGVSRSKCADIITASVPVSWALSIIISETVDAADYYDGFGTGELVVSIRAYQWGWVYYFPKNIDINYDVNPTNSSSVGNSLKYSKSGDSTSNANTYLEFLKSNKNTKLTSTPSNHVLSPIDNSKVLSFINNNSLGKSTLQSSDAFKKIQFFSKTNSQELFNSESEFSLKYAKIKSLYIDESNTNDSISYGTLRQNSYNSLSSNLNSNETYLDSKSTSTMRSWNWGGEESLDKNTNNKINTELRQNNYQDLNSNNFYNIGANLDISTDLNNYGVLNSNKEMYSIDNISQTKLSSVSTDNEARDYSSNLTKYSTQKLLPSERSSREFSLIKPLVDSLNLDSNNNLNSISTMKSVFSSNHLATSSISSSMPNLSFDKFNMDGLASSIISSEGEKTPDHVINSYWNTMWSNIDGSSRVEKNTYYVEDLKVNYLPTINDYSDYDFRNWQSLELLEDCFWESSYSSFSQDDIWNYNKDYSGSKIYNSKEELGNDTFAENSLIDTTSVDENLLFTSIYSRDLINNSKLINSNNFSTFLSENNLDDIEDSYSNMKYLSMISKPNYVQNFNSLSNFYIPNSYAQVLNTFRSSSDETLVNFTSNYINNTYGNFTSNVNNNELRLSNSLKLRSTAKNSISNYNALQKVFHSRLDEGRSNSRINDISNSYLNFPFINESKSNYESMLGKNKESFFSTSSYVNTITKNFNSLYGVMNSMNIYFSDIPFLLSRQSDSSRHLWFDWSSKWNSMEVQPASSARYSLLGLPYSSKNFEYSGANGKEISSSDVYLTRLSKSRRNYMSNWSFTPYMYSRISNWYNTGSGKSNLFTKPSVSKTLESLNLVSNYWSNSYIYSSMNNTSPTNSITSTPGRSSIQPGMGVHSYVHNVSTLSDILSKREYIYKEYFINNSLNVNLPKYLVSSPSNPLMYDIQSSHSLINPSSFTSEVSRDFFYQNLNFLKISLVSDMISTLDKSLSNSGLNYSLISNYLLFYVMGYESNYSNNNNLELYKNQYRPMKKGVNNMIRLHATGAIAMPIEIRLHILASSKDVIHSWSIPSAGIKIDCVPGFSSHRVAIFLVSGIFWGQCMEICGRFHHWMPIIVYFMKRDLFFLWCTHFIHYSNNDNSFDMSAKNLISNVKPASFDKSAWLSNYNI